MTEIPPLWFVGGCSGTQVWNTISEVLSGRVTPELRHLQVSLGAQISYRKAADLLRMLLPPIGGTTHTTIRSRVIAVGERIDEEIRQEITENRKPDKVAQQMVITQQTSNTVVSGNVVSQDQPSGSSVAQGSPVNLVISSGPEIVSVPNVEGLTQAAATAAITAAKLTVGTVTQQTSDTVAPGKVISQDPASAGSVGKVGP